MHLYIRKIKLFMYIVHVHNTNSEKKNTQEKK